MKNISKKILVGVIYTAVLAFVVILIFSFEGKPGTVSAKIGFITPGDISTTGWSAINYKGVKSACEELGVELVALSQINENDGSCHKAVDELVNKGCGMIILNSMVFADEMKESLEDYPETTFYAANAGYSRQNLTSYSSRMYQVRYLSGIVAGMYTKTNKIGFVAGAKDNMVYRGINAFALGARRVNPDAEIIVAWTQGLDDKQSELEAANELIENEDIDVITYHQHLPYVIDAAEEHGTASIGYYEPVENASENYLTCAICNWAPVYEKMILEYLRGQGNAVSADWLGIESGLMGLSDYSPLVSDEIRQRVEEAIDELSSGTDVFSGEIYDNLKNKRCSEGEAISDYTLLNEMDWLAEGVRVYEK